MDKRILFLGTALAALLQTDALATEIPFAGGASGVDPLGHAYSFDGTTFKLASTLGNFNPAGVAIGSSTGVKSFSLALAGPAVFDPTPVNLPNACPPGQYAVYLSLNPLVIVCMGFNGGGPFVRNTWQYSMRIPGTVTFDAPDGGLTAGVSDFEFIMHFPQAMDPASFSFTASWSDVGVVPEPVTATLLLLGLAGVAARRKLAA